MTSYVDKEIAYVAAPASFADLAAVQVWAEDLVGALVAAGLMADS